MLVATHDRACVGSAEALGNLPFVKVYSLIGKIQEQAGQQMNANGQVTQSELVAPAPPTVESSFDE